MAPSNNKWKIGFLPVSLIELCFSKIPQQKQDCCLASVNVDISMFDRKAPRQNSMEALKDLAVFTAFVILFIALQILFLFRIPKNGTLPSFLIAVRSDEMYVHLRIFSYRPLVFVLAAEILNHVMKSLLMYLEPEGPYF